MAKLSALDDRATVARLDPSGLLGRIEALPEQCQSAWDDALAFTLPPEYAGCTSVVVLGMGGSAIAGDCFRSLALKSPKPVHVVRGYDLPGFVSGDALVVACSHSGNTEETLSAFEQALAAGARGVVLTMGGRLGDLARERRIPALTYQYEGEPRAALGHQLMALLGIGQQVGALPKQHDAVVEAIRVMRAQRDEIDFDVPCERNAAKQLAGRLGERGLPVVIGTGALANAAMRWKTQFNENSKCWAIWEELPELDHNTIVGFGLTADVVRLLHAIFIESPSMSPRLRRRYDLTAEALADAGVSNERVQSVGQGTLAQLLSAIHLGDLVSYYLALLYDVDPSPVQPIEKLKRGLAEG